MPRSITRVKLIRSALPHSELNVRIARLAVLYEDLRIEVYAAAEEDIPLLDSIGDDLKTETGELVTVEVKHEDKAAVRAFYEQFAGPTEGRPDNFCQAQDTAF
jgi:hypothetical protein